MLYSKIVKYVNFPLYNLLSRKFEFYTQYRRLEKNQWLSAGEIEKIRWGLFVELMKHAQRSTAFYADVLAGLSARPEDFCNMSAYRQLPIVTKQTLQTDRARLRARDLPPNSYLEDASGGSTGEPTIFYVDKTRYIRRSWEQIRHDRWSGWDLGERIAVLWGLSHEHSGLGRRLYKETKNALLRRRMVIDAFALTEERMTAFAKEMIRKKPTMLLAYANAVYTFAKYLDESGFSAARIGLRGVISSAEKLYDFQRELIERVFQCPVFDRLGSREVGLIASECDRHEGLHINADNAIIEFVDEDGIPVPPGVAGRILVTDLLNRAMPLVRYDTGDIGVSSDRECSCGRGLPLMKCVEGRTSDFILTRDRRNIHGEFFTHLFYGVRGLRQFQLVQKSMDRIEIKLIIDPLWNPLTESKIAKEIRSYMGDPELEIGFLYVDEIPKTRSGKHRFTISEMIQ